MEQHSVGEPKKVKKFQPLMPKNDAAPEEWKTIKSKVVKPSQRAPKTLVSKFLNALNAANPLREDANAVLIDSSAIQTEAVDLAIPNKLVGTRHWAAKQVVACADTDANGHTYVAARPHL